MQNQTPAIISQMTTTLGGRIRIVQVEKIENATGLSTRYNALEAMQDPIVAELTRAISQEPNRFSLRPTDNGLRFCCEWRHCTWYVYSY
jgi:hypothetical protein